MPGPTSDEEAPNASLPNATGWDYEYMLSEWKITFLPWAKVGAVLVAIGIMLMIAPALLKCVPKIGKNKKKKNADSLAALVAKSNAETLIGSRIPSPEERARMQAREAEQARAERMADVARATAARTRFWEQQRAEQTKSWISTQLSVSYRRFLTCLRFFSLNSRFGIIFVTVGLILMYHFVRVVGRVVQEYEMSAGDAIAGKVAQAATPVADAMNNILSSVKDGISYVMSTLYFIASIIVSIVALIGASWIVRCYNQFYPKRRTYTTTCETRELTPAIQAPPAPRSGFDIVLPRGQLSPGGPPRYQPLDNEQA